MQLLALGPELLRSPEGVLAELAELGKLSFFNGFEGFNAYCRKLEGRRHNAGKTHRWL